MKEIILVRNGDGSLLDNDTFTDEVERIERMPIQHKGWQSVRYKGNRYQLFGGIRTERFISLKLPIGRRDQARFSY